MARMPERWLDGSIRPPDEEVEALHALVARLAGPGFAIERALGGMSTPVYRLRRGDECLYLRTSEDAGGSMHAEVAVHEHLRAAGVAVPEVIAMDEAPEIGRGVMLVREVPGVPLAGANGVDRTPILRAAGRDLARINAVAVEGFGWVRRDEPVWPPRAEHAAYAAFVEDSSAGLAFVAERLSTREARALESCVDEAKSDDPPTRLAHGDFDATHIFQRDGGYTGVIDFGEVTQVQGDITNRLQRSATIIVATQLCRWIDRDGIGSLDRPSGRWWLDRLRALLVGAV
jgi:aminoglycoside phosphotransferase (APT) family kinase protein